MAPLGQEASEIILGVVECALQQLFETHPSIPSFDDALASYCGRRRFRARDRDRFAIHRKLRRSACSPLAWDPASHTISSDLDGHFISVDPTGGAGGVRVAAQPRACMVGGRSQGYVGGGAAAINAEFATSFVR